MARIGDAGGSDTVVVVVFGFFKVFKFASMQLDVDAFLFLLFPCCSDVVVASSLLTPNKTAVGVSGENHEDGVVEPALPFLLLETAVSFVVCKGGIVVAVAAA